LSPHLLPVFISLADQYFFIFNRLFTSAIIIALEMRDPVCESGIQEMLYKISAIGPLTGRKAGMERIPFLAIAVMLEMVLSFVPARAQNAYITNGDDATVSVIDTGTNAVVGGPVAVGTGPAGVAVTADGTEIYIANYVANTVSAIATATNTVTTISGFDSPYGLAVIPDGSTVYVANYIGGTVSVIASASNAVISSVPVGSNPWGVAATPDGSTVYVANSGSNTLSVIATASNVVTDTITGLSGPIGVAVSPDGSTVYVANSGSNTLSAIATANNIVIATINVGNAPNGLAVSPDGSTVYVANSGSNTVSLIDTASDTVTTAVPVGATPLGVAVTPGGGKVYVANSGAHNVSVIAVASDTVTTVNVGGGPVAFGKFIGPPTLTVSETGSGSGQVRSSSPGINCGAGGNSCASPFAGGTRVTLTASAAAGSSFAGWSGDGCSGTASCVVTLTDNTTVSATFTVIPSFMLSVVAGGTGSGTVTSNPSGINCGSMCDASFQSGTGVTLTASAASGSTFAGWSGGGCSGTASCVVILTGDTTVTSTFTATPSFNLLVALAGTGSGMVTSNPSGISCGASCIASFQSGAPVVLTAVPASGSTFIGWSGGGCSGTGTCSVTMSAAETVSATFTAATATLTVATAGSGSGQVTSSPADINCSASGNQCAATFAVGTQITLTASASAGSTFAGWSGSGCSGTGTCTVTMSAAESVSATFMQLVTLTVAASGAGAGQITSSPAGIKCSASSHQCRAPFAAGTQITLSSSANAGSSFSGWSGGGCSGTGTCQVTVMADTNVIATFEKKITTKMLSVALIGGGAGTVTSTPSGINCGATCAASFDTGTQITLTAAAASSSTFAGWSGGGCGGIDGCTLTLSADATVTATVVANSPGNLTLVAAILPESRSVQIGDTATAFATMIDAGPADAATCTIAPATSIPASFLFQTTDPSTNALTGSPNTPVNIAAGRAGTFVIAFTPTAAFSPTDVPFTFTCANAPSPAASTVGVDTLNLSGSTTAVPDIVALAASADPGYVDIPGATGIGVFAVATVNLGMDATIMAAANTGTANLPVTLMLCQTDPTSGACLASPSASVTAGIPPNATPTFGIFATGSAPVADMPGINRIFVTFTDVNGVLRGETSVAVRTQ
jgi:YVTN family beta-propeller protein